MATESVKILTTVVAKVRKQKKKSGINVGKFFELAALEKLEREKETSLYENWKNPPVTYTDKI